MAAGTASSVEVPMSEMNVTPLIDVMLVLLIMFVITIPIQTHAVKLDLPGRTDVPIPRSDANLLTVARSGALAWNGAPIDKNVLQQELRVTQQMRPVPELHLQPDADAPYGVVDELLGTIKREHVEKMGFVGNEAYAPR